MSEFFIGYVTEDPSPEYSKAIRKAKTKEELVETIKYYKQCADDALKQAKKLTDEDFKDFARNIKVANKEHSKEWTESFIDRFGYIAVPTKMMLASLVSDQFHAPWGTAFIRCEGIGWDKIR